MQHKNSTKSGAVQSGETTANRRFLNQMRRRNASQIPQEFNSPTARLWHQASSEPTSSSVCSQARALSKCDADRRGGEKQTTRTICVSWRAPDSG